MTTFTPPRTVPFTRPCRACGQLFQTRCKLQVIRRDDGTETARWLAAETQCRTCQPSLFDAVEVAAT